MFIEQLRVEGFRNLAKTELTFFPGVNLIVGQNGQGKTNLLEAVSFLGSTKSFRTSRSIDAIARGGQTFAISGLVVDRAGPFWLGSSVGSKGKEALVHGKPVGSLHEYLGKLMTITFSPQDMDLVRGGPAERRSLVDRHLVDISPQLVVSLVTYARALRAKMALLKRGSPSYRSIEPWNRILAKEMRIISAARSQFVQELSPRAAACYERFTSSPGEQLTSEYRSNVLAYASEDEVVRALEQDFERETATKAVRIGIHRDDLSLALSGKPAREFASQGQARSIVLSLKLAILELLEAHRHESPVVLLDDVDAELDAHRAHHFFQMMIEQGRQVLVTSTDAYHGVLRSDASVRVFEVVAGHVRLAS